MNKELVAEVKKRKVFSGLPDTVVWRYLEKNGLDVKAARSDLRKFFGVFLTNRVLKGEDEEVLKSHISSKGRDYDEFYGEIFENKKIIQSVVDLGCGVNGLSLLDLHDHAGVLQYYGIEASGQVVDLVNRFFDEKCSGYDAHVVWGDLMDKDLVLDVIKKAESPRVVMMLQVVDALENSQKDYSKEVLLGIRELLGKDDLIVISMPLKSISGRKRFEVRRTWLIKFLEKNFKIKKEKEIGNEKIIILDV